MISELLLCLSTFFFSQHSRVDPLGIALSETKRRVFSEFLRKCVGAVNGTSRQSLQREDRGYNEEATTSLITVGEGSKSIRQIDTSIVPSAKSVLNIARAFRLRAEFAFSIDQFSRRDQREASEAPAASLYVEEAVRSQIEEFQTHVAEEGLLIRQWICEWALSDANGNFGGAGAEVSLNSIPNIAHFSVENSIDLLDELSALSKSSYDDLCLQVMGELNNSSWSDANVAFLASLIGHLKANLADLTPHQAVRVIRVLVGLITAEVEIGDSSRQLLSEETIESFQSEKKIEINLITEDGLELRVGAPSPVIGLMDGRVAMKELMNSFVQVAAAGIHLLDNEACFDLLLSSK